MSILWEFGFVAGAEEHVISSGEQKREDGQEEKQWFNQDGDSKKWSYNEFTHILYVFLSLQILQVLSLEPVMIVSLSR